jgi:hypothetical protein
MSQRGWPQTNSGCRDRRAGQERKCEDNTTFIGPDTGADCQISAPRRVRYSGALIAPRSVLAVLVRMVQWGRKVDSRRTVHGYLQVL